MKNPFDEKTYLQRTIEREMDIRGDYFRDQTAIIHSMPFRRLKHKTQVFYAPDNDHVCTRIEHVLHVATIAATVCKGLNRYGWDLDMEMAYAIGIGHDLGHAPFGHQGEKALDKILGGNNAFVHEVNSYRVVEKLANNGQGMNLTFGVKDGIICHNGEKFEQSLKPSTSLNNLDEIKNRQFISNSYEGCIMRFSDKIAYLGRDIEDAVKAGFVEWKNIPEKVQKALGNSNGEIINKLIIDIIEASKNTDSIKLSDEKHELMLELVKFNYEHIYFHKKLQEYNVFCHKIIENIFNHLCELYEKFGRNFELYRQSHIKLDVAFGNHIEKMNDFYQGNEDNIRIIASDYIAGMSDLYALDCIKQITLPKPISFDLR
ncbi:MAG TPA: phosphohydrolase [Bacteroidales bacterium]|nr:MAG: hypothetical protein A2W98_05695 [Bacteroidetes bacterium GWF2_33_38]OFY74933.1 MAG: hypothetical protein A2265_10665 [Bacteroidetes bacterium RIFOXYA12_FULL_33_9]OFY90844.1 MAG: hypothetical protein A2236_06475 [Bacteroidetes bacterium RIFOXYA2_FULL_33_7]HBF89492.1 phosphohydrolase [Bacteroidales bacterium]